MLTQITRKIRHKTLHEISYRLFKMVYHRYKDMQFRFKSEPAVSLCSVPNRLSFLENKNRPVFFFNSDRPRLKKIYHEYFTEELEKTLERAEQFYHQKFRFLGAEFSFSDKIDWNADPISKKPYPLVYYREIDIFSNDETKDIKYVWELNRHQFFIDLAKAYFITGEEKYAQRIINWFYDWVEHNPYKIGVNWTSALEVAVRAYSWIWSFYFLLDWESLDGKFIRDFFKQLYLHGQYLNENLSFYFSPYNHLIGETSALFMIGYLFPELKGATHWAKKGWRVLEKEMPKQFHSDGISVEQATFYHYFTLGFYLMPIILKLQNREAIPPEMLFHLQKILDFGMHITKPDGSTPWLGDVDNARSIYFNDPEHWDFRNFLAIGTVLFKSPTFKYASGKLWEDVLWLFGEKGIATYNEINPQQPPEKVKWFPESGYLVARSGWKSDAHFLLVDCGPIADGVFPDDVPSAAHGHADILHFEYSPYGKNLLVDIGFHNYKGDFTWHKYFRETFAHNCLVIDGKSQAKHGDIIFWSNAAQPLPLTVSIKEDFIYFKGSHNAYQDLPGKIDYVRHILFLENDFLFILDEVLGQGKHRIESFLHFREGEVKKQDDFRFFVKSDDVFLQGVSLGHPMRLEIYQGGENVSEGWLSPLYRFPIKAPLLYRFTETMLPFYNLTLLCASKSQSIRLESVEKNKVEIFSEKNQVICTLNQNNLPASAEIADEQNPLVTIEWINGDAKKNIQIFHSSIIESNISGRKI